MGKNNFQTQIISTIAGLLLKNEAADIIDFLKTENRILRGKIKGRIQFTKYDRQRLIHTGIPIKERLHEFISIVKPETLLAWNRRMKKEKWMYDNSKKRPGRPKKGAETEQIVLRLATENSWGYRRIQGEMRKLGHGVSSSYVRDVLKRNGIPPSGQRNGLSWKQFILSQMGITWATDFFTEEIWTKAGLMTCYVLFFIHLGSRRIHIAGVTPHPNYAWISQQARNFSMQLSELSEHSCRYIIHDRDTSFHALDMVLSGEGVKIVKRPPRTPKCNGFVERCVREMREVLNNMIIIGEFHLSHVLKNVERYHNRHRSHQGLSNTIPLGFDYPVQPALPKQIQCEGSLGGLLNHYYVEKKAA